MKIVRCIDAIKWQLSRTHVLAEYSKIIALSCLVATSVGVNAAVIVKPVTLNGEAQGDGPMLLSQSGRYILSNRKGVFDIKSQLFTEFPSAYGYPCGAISSNGRYVSYSSRFGDNGSIGQVLDRVTNVSGDIPSHDEPVALGNNGAAVTRDQSQSVSKGALLIVKNHHHQSLPGFRGPYSCMARKNWSSDDAKVVLYPGVYPDGSGERFLLYNAETKQTMPFEPVMADGSLVFWNMQNSLGNSNIALSSNGKFIAFLSESNTPVEKKLWIASIHAQGYTQRVFDLAKHWVTAERGLSVSRDGRFISFIGNLLPNHAEYPVEQGLSSSLSRVFRYDSKLDKVITVSVASDNGPLRNSASSPQKVDFGNSTMISDDGSVVAFSSNADNIVSTKTVSSSKLYFYYAILDNSFARKYQFVDMPNSDNGFKPFAPMTLVGNNTWEGFITFDGVGADKFKFDAGGEVINGVYQGAADWGINFGAGNVAGKVEKNGPDIAVNKGAGTYKITFNDTTLQYSVDRIYDKGHDFILRQMVDVNADGMADFCRFVGDIPSEFLSCNLATSSGFSSNQYGFSAGFLDRGHSFFQQLADINKDNRADYCRFTGNLLDATLTCTKATSTGFASEQLAYRSVPGLDKGYDTLRQLADVNGDQIADFCRFVGHFSTAYLSCNLGEGAGFSANQYGFNSIASLDKGYDFFRQMIDVNGDKKADYCRFAGHYPTAFLGCTTAASGGFTAAQYNYRSADGLDKGYDIFRQLADVNGDGFADYCRFVGHYDTAYLSCNLGGLASFTNTRFNSVEGLDKGSDVYRRLVDVNNDKRADYCRFIGPTNTSRLSCNLATATGFSSQLTEYKPL